MKKRLISIAISIVVFAALFAMIAPVQAQPPPTYLVVGQVFDTDGNPVNDVNVNVTCIPTEESVSSTTAEGGWYSVELGNEPYPLPAPGDTLRLFADAGDGRTNTTEVPATESPQRVKLILQEPGPYLVTYTISKHTITPPETTEIDVKFSERVKAWIKIEDSDRNLVKQLYYSSSVINPSPQTWNGTYTDGTQVPDGGDYYVNITGTNTTTELSVVNNTEIIRTTEPDLTVTEIAAYHYKKGASPWFNLLNDVNVTVKNKGSESAGAFDVNLYADSELIGTQTVPAGLEPGDSTTVQFDNWIPTGEDCLKTIDNVCHYNPSYKDYNLKAVVAGKTFTAETEACYNGYMADHPLENVAHGTLNGGLLFTTGDGEYKGLYNVGDTQVTNYDITLPASATVEFANLNVYYTWSKPKEGIDVACAEMEVSITNPAGTTDVVPLKKSYNDIKCECPGAAWEYPWGNYVYDVADYIDGSGTYTVTVKNNCAEKCKYFCPAAPGIVLVYEDANAPKIEYWINEGADILIGGRRADGGFLSLAECINTATFPGSIGTSVTATLGVVSPWGGSSWQTGMTNVLYFNDVELGKGVYHGYSETYDKTVDGISMHIGSTNAQIGVNVTDVTSYLQASDNVVGQGDDGDNMMPSNAFLVVEVEKPECGDVNCDGVIDVEDAGKLLYYVGFPGQYTICSDWAADVNCDGVIDVEDAGKLLYYVGFPGQYTLNCCE